jgi:hypothetical protein
VKWPLSTCQDLVPLKDHEGKDKGH